MADNEKTFENLFVLLERHQLSKPTRWEPGVVDEIDYLRTLRSSRLTLLRARRALRALIRQRLATGCEAGGGAKSDLSDRSTEKPSEHFQIDATVMDLVLVAPGEDSVAGPCVRPAVVALTDSLSRQIQGVEIGVLPFSASSDADHSPTE